MDNHATNNLPDLKVTKRWNTADSTRVSVPKVDTFLNEILEVSKKHGFSISHEDKHGSFIITLNNPDDAEWLLEASVELPNTNIRGE